MSYRVNIIFHDETTGDAYCLLTPRNLAIDANKSLLQEMLLLLVRTIDEQAALGNPRMAKLAADAVRALASEYGADLLPAAADSLADITVRIRRVNGEFRLSCKTMDPSRRNLPAPGPDPLDPIDGFDGNAEQLRDLIFEIDWQGY